MTGPAFDAHSRFIREVLDRAMTGKPSTHPFEPNPEKPRECVRCGRREEAHRCS